MVESCCSLVKIVPGILRTIKVWVRILVAMWGPASEDERYSRELRDVAAELRRLARGRSTDRAALLASARRLETLADDPDAESVDPRFAASRVRRP